MKTIEYAIKTSKMSSIIQHHKDAINAMMYRFITNTVGGAIPLFTKSIIRFNNVSVGIVIELFSELR